LGYIDAERHAANIRHAVHSQSVKSIIIRLRNLYALDYEGALMLAEAALACEHAHKKLLFSSASGTIEERIRTAKPFGALKRQNLFIAKTGEALEQLRRA
jgi:MFS superfamily sulfate permease-like transporter